MSGLKQISLTRLPPVEKSASADKVTCKSCLRQNLLTILMFVSVVIGVALGVGLREIDADPKKEIFWTKRNSMYLSFPGELFLRMLKCLILPLIVSSLISAVGALDTKLSAKIGMKSLVYYIVTTLFAILLGIILVIAIGPGRGGDSSTSAGKTKAKPTTTVDTLLDLVRNLFPPSIAEATIRQTSTELTRPKNASQNDTDYYNWDLKIKSIDNVNLLGIVVFCIILGIVTGLMREHGKPLIDFFTALGDAMMIMTKWVIWLSPIGVVSLVAGKILEMESLSVVAGQVGFYTITVLLGLFIHGFIVLPLIYFIVVRKQPYSYIFNMAQAVTTAFGTSSSTASLPVTISCLEEKNGIDPRVARFCLPIGATINMDGTALYEAVAAIFIAQVREVPLDIGKVIAISITATAASIGAAGIPQAGLVTMVMVLNAVGLPAEDMALIFVVDWFLDRFRTSVNVVGDSYGAGIVAHLCCEELQGSKRKSVGEHYDEVVITPQEQLEVNDITDYKNSESKEMTSM